MTVGGGSVDGGKGRDDDPHRDEFSQAELVARGSRPPLHRDLTFYAAFVGALAGVGLLAVTTVPMVVWTVSVYVIVGGILGGMAWFFSPFPNAIEAND